MSLREGSTSAVLLVGAEWEYRDGSRWRSLNDLRDHLLRKTRAEHGTPAWATAVAGVPA